MDELGSLAGAGRGDRPITLVNATIWTANRNDPIAETVTFRHGTIVDVGGPPEPGGEVVDLGGRFVMPGIHDAHTHLLFSGLKFRYECRLRPDSGPAAIVDDLTVCRCGAHDLDDLDDWIVGGEFNPYNFDAGSVDRAALDAAFPDRPVFLYDYSIHHGLANGAALERAGITDGTPDPSGGRYLRRDDGAALTGELVEQATWPVLRAIPDYRDRTYQSALAWAVATSNRYGITSVQEASASRHQLDAFRALESRNELTLRVAAHLVWREERFGMATLPDLEATLAARAAYASDLVNTNFVKLWLDGAPLPPHFTEARLDEHGQPTGEKILIPRDELTTRLIEFDRAGLGIKVHCAAEGSVRLALDVFTEVRRANGPDGPTHEVAHCGFVHPDDLHRFHELRVVAEMSPAIWHRREPEFRVLDAGFKFRTLEQAGATITVGSDWIITPDPNLFPALQGIVERGDESVAVERALEYMTIQGARVIGQDHRQGSIEAGKVADLIVLDRNLLAAPVEQIGDTIVLATVFDGRVVHHQSGGTEHS